MLILIYISVTGYMILMAIYYVGRTLLILQSGLLHPVRLLLISRLPSTVQVVVVVFLPGGAGILLLTLRTPSLKDGRFTLLFNNQLVSANENSIYDITYL